MTFCLSVDSSAYRSHLVSVMNQTAVSGADLVPVIKGNGYGFTSEILFEEAKKLGVSRIAIGTVWELPQALAKFSGEIVVLEPFNSADQNATLQWKSILQHNADRVIVTLRSNDFVAAAAAGVKLAYAEGVTSLHRFGISAQELTSLKISDLGGITLRGISLHLPIADSTKVFDATSEVSNVINAKKLSGKLSEIWNWLKLFQEFATADHLPLHMSLSHISNAELTELKSMCQRYGYNFTFDIRIGTSLWLGNKQALSVKATILQIHELTDSQRIGYHQVKSGKRQRLLVVSGGTSHGVALAAPTSSSSIRKKGIAISEGFNQAIGRVRSPFSHNGEFLNFAEPPHMHVSMVLSDDAQLQVGDLLDCRVRNSIAAFDQVLGL